MNRSTFQVLIKVHHTCLRVRSTADAELNTYRLMFDDGVDYERMTHVVLAYSAIVTLYISCVWSSMTRLDNGCQHPIKARSTDNDRLRKKYTLLVDS